VQRHHIRRPGHWWLGDGVGVSVRANTCARGVTRRRSHNLCTWPEAIRSRRVRRRRLVGRTPLARLPRKILVGVRQCCRALEAAIRLLLEPGERRAVLAEGEMGLGSGSFTGAARAASRPGESSKLVSSAAGACEEEALSGCSGSSAGGACPAQGQPGHHSPLTQKNVHLGRLRLRPHRRSNHRLCNPVGQDQ
jgi:hypothetical protein